MQYVAIQIGARRNYAVPALLEKAGLLSHFYTDICAETGLGKILSWGQSLPVAGPRLRRLAGRRLPPGVAPKTTTFAGPLLAHGVRSSMARTAGERYRAHVAWTNAFGEAIARRGFGSATHVYSTLGEGTPALRAARQRGLRVATEIYILLSSDAIVAEERRQFPGWENSSPDYEKVRAELMTDEAMLEATDLAICPADSVRDDLVHNFGFPAEKTSVVPYEVSEEWFEYTNRPQAGRILFAGSACLRKGIHYFAKAAEILTRRGLRYEFRVAGDTTPEVIGRSECRHLNFLGRVPRGQMTQEFESADVMVLPTLAEGSASVVYQSLAIGVPVVTTHEAGSVVRDGIEGRIIPCRDAERLADAIAEIVEDRSRREEYSKAGRARALEYTWERYGQRLIAALS